MKNYVPMWFNFYAAFAFHTLNIPIKTLKQVQGED